MNRWTLSPQQRQEVEDLPVAVLERAFVVPKLDPLVQSDRSAEMSDWLEERGVKESWLLAAYSPLAKGRVLDDPTLKQISDAHRKTPIQVTLRWLIQQGIAAIPKAGSTKHIETNLDIFDFELSNEEMLSIMH